MIENNTENQEQEKKNIVQSTVPRRFSRRIDDDQTTSSTWLISFTDVMALMLTFFVLLFAMSNPKQEDWEQLTKKIQENFNRFYGQQENRGAQDAINIQKINFSRALDLRYLKALFNDAWVETEPSLKAVSLIENGDSLIISLPQNLLFETGKAEIKPQASKALFTIATSLRRIKNRIEVVGHTDPTPTRGGYGFASNWELSLARAASVAGVLENVGYDRPILIRGQAAGRYAELPADISEAQRRDLSRRVDIVIMEDDGRQETKLFDIGLP